MLDTRAQVGKVNTLEANQGIYFIVSEADSDPDITTGLDIIPDPLAKISSIEDSPKSSLDLSKPYSV